MFFFSKNTRRNKNKNFYSFATKFCFWNNDKMYPIYDRLVAKIFKEYSYNNVCDFNCTGINFKNYEKFRNVINNFCDCFNISQLPSAAAFSTAI